MPELSRAEVLAFIAANVRRLRARRFTQQALSDATGISVQYLSRIERGTVNLKVDTIVRIANRLEVDPSALLRRARFKPPKPGRPKKRSPRPRG